MINLVESMMSVTKRKEIKFKLKADWIDDIIGNRRVDYFTFFV